MKIRSLNLRRLKNTEREQLAVREPRLENAEALRLNEKHVLAITQLENKHIKELRDLVQSFERKLEVQKKTDTYQIGELLAQLRLADRRHRSLMDAALKIKNENAMEAQRIKIMHDLQMEARDRNAEICFRMHYEDFASIQKETSLVLEYLSVLRLEGRKKVDSFLAQMGISSKEEKVGSWMPSITGSLSKIDLKNTLPNLVAQASEELWSYLDSSYGWISQFIRSQQSFATEKLRTMSLADSIGRGAMESATLEIGEDLAPTEPRLIDASYPSSIHAARTKNRVCLFAGFNAKGKIAPYVIDYLKEINNYADIYYMADGDLPEEELLKLQFYCVGAWSLAHGKYDFGSYSELAKNYIGWETLSTYSEVIFANDSCFCLQSFASVFSRMNSEPCDVWGLLATDENNKDRIYSLEEYIAVPTRMVPLFCIGTYFIVFRSTVFNDIEFIEFLNSVKPQASRLEVCIKYEMGLTAFLKRRQYKISSYIDIIYRNVCIYDRQAFRVLKKGFPLLKTRIFKDNPLSVPYLDAAPSIVASYTGSDRIFRYLSEAEGGSDQVPSQFTTYVPYQNEFVVIYFNVARDVIGGGMLSINRLVENSILLADKFGFEVLVSGLPLENDAVEYTLFHAAAPMVHFSDIVAKGIPKKAILNIPEYYVPHFIEGLDDRYRRWLSSIPWLQVNILNQNQDYLPDRHHLEVLREITDDVTITAAHVRYATQELADQCDCPVSLLTPFLPEFYSSQFEEKEKIILFSADEISLQFGISREDVIHKLSLEFPDFELITIQNISLEEYKRLISKAMFTITFGEGYDGYFIEPYLSGSIAFSVFNDVFFPVDFGSAPTVYDSWGHLCDSIVYDMRRLQHDGALYKATVEFVLDKIRLYTNTALSIRNLQDFYARRFSFLPSIFARNKLFHNGAGQINDPSDIFRLA